jgi:exonuclease SbcC
LEGLNRVLSKEELDAAALQQVSERARIVINAMQAREVRLQLLEKQAQVDALSQKILTLEAKVAQLAKGLTACNAIEKLLQRERQAAIERHIAAYGPMITTIQQRLRSVYGFGGVRLEARGGEATVQVEWRNKSVHVPPTDFFSDSQRQILMLSIFLAGGLRQNWSGFAPILLDDPVTHFDDLNAYGFVELVRGIISTSPDESQIIISTCEERLFSLMQKKFSRLPSGSIFYEFIGMSDKGPMVERR